jgi:hypothetical protein
MPGSGLASPDRSDAAEQVHVLPAEVSDLDSPASSGNGQNRCAMGRRPFRLACGGFKQLALEVCGENPTDRALALWKRPNVLGYGTPDLRPLQHPPENPGFHVYGPARYLNRLPRAFTQAAPRPAISAFHTLRSLHAQTAANAWKVVMYVGRRNAEAYAERIRSANDALNLRRSDLSQINPELAETRHHPNASHLEVVHDRSLKFPVLFTPISLEQFCQGSAFRKAVIMTEARG